MKKVLNVVAYFVLAGVILGQLDRGMRWFLRTYDPVYRSILDAKGSDETSEAKENVSAILKNKNGQVTEVRR